MNNLVTIAIFQNSFQANIIVAKLKDAGIESALLNDNSFSLKPFPSKFSSGIKLQVLDVNVEDAMLILNDVTEDSDNP